MKAIEIEAAELYALILALRKDIQDAHTNEVSREYRQHLLEKLQSLWDGNPQPKDMFVMHRKLTSEEERQEAMDAMMRQMVERYLSEHPERRGEP